MNPVERCGRLCLALPESFELETWDHPTFRVGSGPGKIFCTAASDGSSITVKADPTEREALLALGERFLRPALRRHQGLGGHPAGERANRPVETYSNGVRHVNVPDPDGNTIAFAEPPDGRERATSIGRIRRFLVGGPVRRPLVDTAVIGGRLK